MSATLDASGVSVLIGRTRDWFYRNRARLMECHGFPQPLPGIPWLWSRERVEAWIAGNEPTTPEDDDAMKRAREIARRLRAADASRDHLRQTIAVDPRAIDPDPGGR